MESEVSALNPFLVISWEGVDPFKVVMDKKVMDPSNFKGEDVAADPSTPSTQVEAGVLLPLPQGETGIPPPPPQDDDWLPPSSPA
ncbi:hypothetical protein RJT34_07212 [Clitoria ternatea]|uniref:Uncharacterized protein n=1 Tax=Clitoria ternatea TaxID=43366 RepID=A0AAN9PTX5_CLITE